MLPPIWSRAADHEEDERKIHPDGLWWLKVKGESLLSVLRETAGGHESILVIG